ncbi:MAG TPA: lactate utilization protein [Desulfovibrio sp.]|uniref:lactate utilization protein n=1 Tax=Desulfovibrio TaxID=872 RepID=UPI00041F76C5|nr:MULTISPECIES: lactate utilization protein [Desulfovibrio]MDY0306416.1 lactate utilization protein [Desulfovibrionaceae bacterium]HMM40256.1 lactate utilization protein [Desulfovibrio sp.]
MREPIDKYWSRRLDDVAEALDDNGFEVFRATCEEDVRRIALSEILPALGPRTVSFGGSTTVVSSGLYQALKDSIGCEVLDVFDKSLSEPDKLELRRRALTCDLFVTGTNALTEAGQLVNLDMIGNRVAALTFGPRNVLVVLGRNKLVADLSAAMRRVKDYAAPVNASRLAKKTPCVKTARCMDCNSPERICNVWTITEKSFPKGRIKIILVNQDLGF